ncbi:DUF1501 domain-containing protein [Sphingomonas sp.]|uniref:DUF1501 domain-containing protein n=1 Tax=Sphingomonas sp. TaxID=28214 RepID=UPI001B0A27C5|nr:DUF1501 domain-containing protein [Sphingomonas sp.]MBO9711513.1 DUF1501 domain-containing protein [Sphingomonas sp.]
MSNESRRAFLKRSAALGVAGAASPFVTQLAGIGEAAAAAAPTDYKALVCIFLTGGNDYANTLPPYDPASYALYQAARPALAHDRAALAATALTPSVALAGGRQYALAPTMASLMPVFNAGKMAVVLNVGTLLQPTTKAQYQSSSASLPPKLFSHNDQQSYWQASNPEGATSGWGGRLGDLFQSGNGTAQLTCINAASNAVFMTGRQAIQYSMAPGGPIALLRGSRSLFGSNTAGTALRTIMSASHSHLFENELATTNKRALDLYTQVNGALASAPESNFGLFPSTKLGGQLQIIARMIAVASQLGAKRQVFFASVGGFDMHDDLAMKHPGQVGMVADALRAFYDTTAALGVADKVTSFTASDFGRTLQPNDNGSDHGWGSMHFVVGGAVKGKRVYGTPPAIGHDTPDDVGAGRLIPTISVDQYAATLSRWFGVSDTDMRTVLPNIGNYNASTWGVGFL